MKEHWFEWCMTAFIIGIFVAVGWIITVVVKQDKQDYQECLKDGLKGYECRAMLRGHRR